MRVREIGRYAGLPSSLANGIDFRMIILADLEIWL